MGVEQAVRQMTMRLKSFNLHSVRPVAGLTDDGAKQSDGIDL